MSEVGQALLEILGAVSVAGAVLFGLSNWLGGVWASRISAREAAKHAAALAEQQAKYESSMAVAQSKLDEELHRITARYDQQLEIAKLAIIRYSDSQFSMYETLWQSLCDLRAAGDELWEVAKLEKVKKFAKQIKDTRAAVHKAALILAEDHYTGLLAVLDEFDRFSLGKTTLVELRAQPAGADYDDLVIEHLINQNGQVRNAYTRKLDEVRLHLKRQIGGAA